MERSLVWGLLEVLKLLRHNLCFQQLITWEGFLEPLQLPDFCYHTMSQLQQMKEKNKIWTSKNAFNFIFVNDIYCFF